MGNTPITRIAHEELHIFAALKPSEVRKPKLILSNVDPTSLEDYEDLLHWIQFCLMHMVPFKAVYTLSTFGKNIDLYINDNSEIN